MADCQTRLLDQLPDDLVDGLQTRYLRKQLDHLADAYMDAHRCVRALEMLAAVGEPGFLEGFTELEVIHLGTGRIGAQAKGGDA